MQQFLDIIDKYMLEIFIVSISLFLLLSIARSFKRNLLIGRGQARFVLEHYDSGTDKLHKWVTFFILFMQLPLFLYVKFLGE